MEKNSLEYLNSTKWYRLLKVLFVASYLVILVGITTTFLKESQTEIPVLSEEKRNQLDGIVLNMERQGASQKEVRLIVDDFKHEYGTGEVVFDKKKAQHGFSFYFIAIIVTSVFFLMMRQTFLYVFTGSFKKIK